MENKNFLVKLGICLFGILLFCNFLNAYECQDKTFQWNVPCNVITPVLNCSSNFNVTITQFGNSSINYTLLTSALGDGTYNFTFNLSNVGTYSLVNCDGSSATIDIVLGTEENEPEFNLWLLFFVIFFLLLIFGYVREEYFLLFIDGCLSLIMGIFIFSNDGFSHYAASDYWFVYPLGWIFVGLGIFLTILSAYALLEDEE